MPPPAHVRLTALGEFRNSSGTKLDIWNASVALVAGSGGTPTSPPYAPADQVTLANAAYTFFKSCFNALPPASHTYLVGAKAAFIQNDGKYPPSWSTGAAYQSTLHLETTAGGAVTQHMPSEVAAVVTLRTIAGTGKRSGRFYMPGPEWTLTDYRYADGDTSTAVTTIATAITTLNTAVASIPSTGGGWKVGVGFTKPVAYLGTAIEVAMGEVPDRQGRRRNKMIENYQSHAIA